MDVVGLTVGTGVGFLLVEIIVGRIDVGRFVGLVIDDGSFVVGLSVGWMVVNCDVGWIVVGCVAVGLIVVGCDVVGLEVGDKVG